MLNWLRGLTRPSRDAGTSSEFAFDKLKPRIERILTMDLRSADAREEHADFVLETLRELNSDIDNLDDTAGDYPDGVISGDAWLAGAGYASHAEALTHHFAKNQWLEHEANASGLWAKATLAVCAHYHHMVGPAMNANADCCRRLGDIDRAVQMWTGVVMDFTFLLDEYDDDPEGPYDNDRIALESLRDACVALQSAGNDNVDSHNLAELVSQTDAILSRPTPTDDGG